MEWVASIEKNIEIIGKKNNEEKKQKQEGEQEQSIEQSYELSSLFWEVLPLMNVPRCTHTTVIQDGCIYVLGGYTGDCERSTVIEIFNLNKNKKQWVQAEA